MISPKSIRVFATIVCILVLSATAFAGPSNGIVVDKFGNVYFVDALRETIWKVNAQGKMSKFLTHKHPHQLSIDDEGNLFGLDYRYSGGRFRESVLWKASPDGSVATVHRSNDKMIPGVFADQNGNRYNWSTAQHESNNPVLYKFSPEGDWVRLAGGANEIRDGRGEKAGFRRISAMALGIDGSLYVTDDTAIRKIDKDGEVTTLAENTKELKKSMIRGRFSGGYNHLFGITVDESSNVYVTNTGNGRLLRISPDGTLETVLNADINWTITGVAVSGTDVYTLEYKIMGESKSGVRVKKISAQGKAVVLAQTGK